MSDIKKPHPWGSPIGSGLLYGYPAVAGSKGRLPCRVLGLVNPDHQLLDTSVNV